MPLQSGDDARAARDGTPLRRRHSTCAGSSRSPDFNLTTDVIVGFPAEDDAAFERTLESSSALGITKVHVFPYSPRPGTRTAADDTVPAAVKKERGARLRAASDELCARHWRAQARQRGRVLVDRPGRGYGDDYTPWLVDAPRSASSCARARSVSRRRGCSLLPPDRDCLFCRLVREGDHVHAADGFVAIRDIDPKAPTHLLVLPERHVDTFRDVGAFPDEEAERMLRSSPTPRSRRASRTTA